MLFTKFNLNWGNLEKVYYSNYWIIKPHSSSKAHFSVFFHSSYPAHLNLNPFKTGSISSRLPPVIVSSLLRPLPFSPSPELLRPLSSSMKLTCLSQGTSLYNPPCHLLQLHGFSILLECPIDLSFLLNFSPIPTSSCNNSNNNELIRAVPFYKPVEFMNRWDTPVIDVVLISSPYSMLGLPFLMRKSGFSESTKIYATEATVKIGQLMMEDLICMHMEYLSFYGPDKNSDSPDLMNLYSAAEIKDCIQRIHSLKFAEETCFNGIFIIKPLSSGSEIGACNWSIKSPKKTIAYLSNSILGSVCAMEFDYVSLIGHDLVIFSDFSSFDSMDCDDDKSEEHKDGTIDTLTDTDEIQEEREKMEFISSCVIESVLASGSVLIPLFRLGIILPLLEHISDSLDSSNMKVPIYIISEKVEEMLSFTNAAPEWLCKKRQEKLFAGEPLFRHVALIKEGKISVHSKIYSSDLLAKWKEPCIVISSHFSLRFGAVVPLLHRWRSDPNSLLILEEGVDAELALLPFQPVEMKVLQCSFLSGIKIKKLSPLLEKLQPKTVLLPENLRARFEIKEQISYSFLYYSYNKAVIIPSSKQKYDAYLDTNLAFQLQPSKLSNNNNIAIARLNARVMLKNGVYLLTSLKKPLNASNKKVLYYGNVDSMHLMRALEEREIVGSIEEMENSDFSIFLTKPVEGLIQVRDKSVVVSCLDEKVSVLIREALSSVCYGI